MNRQTKRRDGQTDRQTYHRHMNRQTKRRDGQTDRYSEADVHTDRQKKKWADRQTDR